MEENKAKQKAFAFYRSFMEAIETLPEQVQQLQAYKVIISYGLDGIEPTQDTDLYVQIIFKQAKPQIDANAKRYQRCVENGKKGGAPKGNKNAKNKNNQETTKEQPKNNQETTTNTNTNTNTKTKTNTNTKEKEKEQNTILKNLSLIYPNISMNVQNSDIDRELDFELLKRAISESDFLQSSTMSFIISNYERVINGTYKTFNHSKNSALDYPQRKITDANKYFTDPSDFDI